jgi:2-hydroxy-6-oxonona-2,4-dienedioate hydrolase
MTPTFWEDLAEESFHQRFIEARGVRTRVLDAGDGPALVMLHGIASHLEAHIPGLPELARMHRVILYDLPGRGWSGKPDRPYTIDFLSDHLVALLDGLEIEEAALSGQSLGGWVAAWTAAHVPDRVTWLVLNNPGNVASRPEALAKVRDSNRQVVEDPTPAAIRERLEWLFHRRELITDEHVAIRVAMYRQPGFPRAMEHISAILDPEIRARYAWSPDWCSKIQAATSVLHGIYNPVASLEDVQTMSRWIPSCRLVVLKNSGEFPQIEEPDGFLQTHREMSQGTASSRE